MKSKERPQDRWDKKNGYIAKSYRMRKSLADEFKAACEDAGVSQSGQIVRMMQAFITSRGKDEDLVEISVELPKWLSDEADRAHVNLSTVLQEALKAEFGVV